MFSVLLLAAALVAEPPRPANPSATRAQGSLLALFSEEDYPKEAMKRAEEGTVRVHLTVSREGRVSDCRIVASSGSAALDSATCRIIRERARFTPARDGRGRPVTDVYSQSVRWQLPDGGGIPDSILRVRFAIDGRGRLGPCRGTLPPQSGSCERLRGMAQQAIEGEAPESLAGRELVLESGTLIGMEGGDSLPVGKGPGERLLRRQVMVLRLAADGTVSDCRPGAADPLPDEAVTLFCAELRVARKLPQEIVERAPMPDGIVEYVAAFTTPRTE